MGHKFDPVNKHRLDSPRRRRMLPAEKILSAMGMQKGDVVADIGCGTGYFTIPMAKLTGSKGLVYAVDTQVDMLKEVENKMTGQLNINIIQSGEYTFRLKEESVDVVFSAFVLHEVLRKAFFVKKMKELLKARGKIVIIDWQKIKTQHGPPLLHRVSQEDAVMFLDKNNFKKIEEINIGKDFYCLRGTK